MKAAIVIASLAACAPYYRDNEDRGRRALDAKDIDAATARAAKVATKQPDEAAQIMRSMIDGHPFVGASYYVTWANYEVDAGHLEIARALLRARIAQLPSGSDSSTLRQWIVATYVKDRWIERAITETKVDSAKLADSLNEFPELRAALQPLVEASVSQADRPRARRQLSDWLRTYGEPDHPALITIVDAIRKPFDDEPQAKEILARADSLVEGNPKAALVLYAEAYRQFSPAVLAAHRDGFSKAIHAFKDPAEADPIAAQLVADGDAAASDGKVADAISDYRRAVLHAPWWPDARRRLALVLDAMGVGDAAQEQTKIADAIAARLAR